MTIQDVADLLGVSKKKVWNAVKTGDLRAIKQKKGKAWRYFVDEEAAEAYRRLLEESGEWETVGQRETQRNETGNESHETGNAIAQQQETVKELFDRLEDAQRRAVILELQLQQAHQRLLSERNEDKQERDARARQAEERALQKEAENAQLRDELDTLKMKIESWSEKRKPWWRKMFSAG